jgi:hypothetical protein
VSGGGGGKMKLRRRRLRRGRLVVGTCTFVVDVRVVKIIQCQIRN